MIYRQLANLFKSAQPRRTGRSSQPARAGRRMGFLEPLEPRRMLAGDPGDLDGSFGTGGLVSDDFGFNRDALFAAVGQQQDGKLIFAGSIEDADSSDLDVIVVRLHVNGALDMSFGDNGSVVIDVGAKEKQQIVEELAIDGLDRIIVVGETGNLTGGSVQQAFAIRLLPNGAPDLNFGVDVNGDLEADAAILPLANDSSAQSVVVDASGRIVVAGTHGTGSSRDFFVGRLLSDGTPDPGFSGDGVTITNVGGGNDTARDVAIAPDGKILVAGTILPNDGTPFRMGVARYNEDGTPDDSFGASEPTTAQNVITIGWEDFDGFTSRAVRGTAIAVQPEGQIVVAGTIPVGSSSNIAVARLDATGALDPLFGVDGTLVFSIDVHDTEDATFGGPALALEQPDPNGDAKILIGTTVWTTHINSDSKFGVARISKDGSIETLEGGYTVQTQIPPETTGGAARHMLNDILVQADGQVVAAGGVWFFPDPDNEPSLPDFQLAAARYLTDLGVAPVADAGGPYQVTAGGTVQLDASLSFQPEDNIEDNETLAFAWDLDGDGLFGETGGDAQRGDEVGETVTFEADSMDSGEIIVRLRVTNQRGLWDFDTATIQVEDSGVYLSEGTLFAIGTSGSDSVSVQIVDGQVVVQSTLTGSSIPHPAEDVHAIVIDAGDGNDVVTISANVMIDVQIDGGAGDDFLMSGGGNDLVLGGSGNDLILTQGGDDVALGGIGNDFIYTGAGNDVLIGGDGADQLFGGGGFDLIIGGSDSDWMFGGAGEDILIGGWTAHDDYETQVQVASIDEIMSIWTSPLSYDERIAKLSEPDPITEEEGLLQLGATVFNDDATDIYFGGAGDDLYFADLGSSGNDDFLLFAAVREEVLATEL